MVRISAPPDSGWETHATKSGAGGAVGVGVGAGVALAVADGVGVAAGLPHPAMPKRAPRTIILLNTGALCPIGTALADAYPAALRSEQMRAVLKQTPGPGFTVDDRPQPEPRDGEVLLQVKAASICGSDVHIYDWNPW